MSNEFTPRTRLEKILCGVVTTAKTRLEKAVEIAVGNAGGGGHASNTPLEVTGTVSENEQGKKVITLDKTAAECFEAAEAGRYTKTTVEGIPVGEGITADFTFIESISIIKAEVAGQTSYTVKAHADINDDTLFIGDGFAGSDIVVLTEV